MESTQELAQMARTGSGLSTGACVSRASETLIVQQRRVGPVTRFRVAKSRIASAAPAPGRPPALDVNPFGDRIFSLWDLLNLAALGRTALTSIGGALGFKHKARSREAKVRVYAAVDILRDEWRRIEDLQAEAAEACHRRVMARRKELALGRAAYLGRAA
ncbi:MAG: hypothetical protein ABS58_09310 [Mesorhizobium sp. SCN 65-20]|nr:MAG: hypothetical protein ABS58_09310 [Mesorhizobium sp. SCN 65-20]